MKRWLFRLVPTAVVVVVGCWLWSTFFPSPEKIIRQRIARVAKLASFEANEGNAVLFAQISELMTCFTSDVQCVIDMPDVGEWTGNGRKALHDSLLSASDNVEALRVKLIDLVVRVAPDKKNATVELTARASLPGDNDFIVHEMKFTMRKVDDDWLIARIETVKTLR